MTTPNSVFDILDRPLDEVIVEEKKSRKPHTDANGLPTAPSGENCKLLKLEVEKQRELINLVLTDVQPPMILVMGWLSESGMPAVQRTNGLAYACAKAFPQRFGRYMTTRSGFAQDDPPFEDLHVMQMSDGTALGFRPDEDGTGYIASVYSQVNHVLRGRNFVPQPPVWSVHLEDITLSGFAQIICEYAGIAYNGRGDWFWD